jgi:hypothetical protein
MYVVAKHRITNPERFLSLAESAAENAPAGVFGRQFCPSHDGGEAVCLWEADSLDSVRAYLDELSAGAAENSYFEVSAAHAIGIPEPIAGSVR